MNKHEKVRRRLRNNVSAFSCLACTWIMPDQYSSKTSLCLKRINILARNPYLIHIHNLNSKYNLSHTYLNSKTCIYIHHSCSPTIFPTKDHQTCWMGHSIWCNNTHLPSLYMLTSYMTLTWHLFYQHLIPIKTTYETYGKLDDEKP